MPLARFIVSHPPTLCQIPVHAYKMYVDLNDLPVSTTLFVSGRWEEEEVNLMKALIREGDVVLDLGANIGYHTLISAGAVGKAGRVYAFEPDPENFSMLKMNVEANDIHNVTLVQKAVSDSTGKGRLFVRPGTFGDYRTYDPHDPKLFDISSSLEIGTTRLDDYFEGYSGRIDLVKMDIQGAEFSALKGMARILEERDPWIIAEFWPKALRSSGCDPRLLLEWLENRGFRFYDLGVGEGRMGPTGPKQLIRRYDVDDRATNLLISRRVLESPASLGST